MWTREPPSCFRCRLTSCRVLAFARVQDAHTCVLGVDRHPDWAFFGIYDGHGGELVAETIGETMLGHILDTEEWKAGSVSVSTHAAGLVVSVSVCLSVCVCVCAPLSPFIFTFSRQHTPDSVGEALRLGFLAQDAKLRELPEVRRGEDHSGSTAVVCMVTPTHIICANAGDSRSTFICSDRTVPMSFDHKPNNEGEQKRIEKAGGTVSMRRVNGDLAVSRGMGDFVYKQSHSLPPTEQQVSPEPQIKIEEIPPDAAFLVLACDGIWDVMSNDDMTTFLLEKIAEGCGDVGDLAEEILDHCLRKDSRDNMSIIIVAFPGAPKANPCVHHVVGCCRMGVFGVTLVGPSPSSAEKSKRLTLKPR